MTDLNDTKPLPEQTPKDAPPNTPQEGAIVADTPENLTIRVTALEHWRQLFQEATNSRFETLMTPEQIKLLIESNVKTALETVNGQVVKLTESNERQVATNEERTRTVNGWMDAQRQAWQALFGRDITDKDSKQLTPSIFDRMKDVEKRAGEADRRADAATLEVSENRADHIAAVDRADKAKAEADRAREEYEKYKPLFDQLQQTVNGLHEAQIEEQARRERSRQLRDKAVKALGELVKSPAVRVGLLAGGTGTGFGVASFLYEVGKALARAIGAN